MTSYDCTQSCWIDQRQGIKYDARLEYAPANMMMKPLCYGLNRSHTADARGTTEGSMIAVLQCYYMECGAYFLNKCRSRLCVQSTVYSRAFLPWHRRTAYGFCLIFWRATPDHAASPFWFFSIAVCIPQEHDSSFSMDKRILE